MTCAGRVLSCLGVHWVRAETHMLHERLFTRPLYQ